MKQTEITNPKAKVIIRDEEKASDSEKFAEDFFYSVEDTIYGDPDSNWDGVISGTLNETVYQSPNPYDSVAVHIENESGEDGGYIHVYGWTVIDPSR